MPGDKTDLFYFQTVQIRLGISNLSLVLYSGSLLYRFSSTIEMCRLIRYTV